MDKAKSNGATAFPQLICAMICEKLLTEADGVASAIRIVDTIQLPPVPKEARKNVILTPLMFLTIFRAGDFRGKAHWEIQVAGPSGKKVKAAQKDLDFNGGPDYGFNLAIPVAFKWDKPGLYWFEVHINKRRMVRSPLNVKVLAEPPKEEGKKIKD